MGIQYKKSNFLQEHKENLLNPDKIKEDCNKVYKLDDNNNLGDLMSYIPNLIKFLWNEPKLIYKLLLSASYKDMKDSLSDLFCNNFYENILSPNYIEHNLLHLITLLLKEEINNIFDKMNEDPNKCLNNFLNNSSCSCILEQFNKKKDVQTFFKTIIFNIIEKLELSSGNREMTFNLNRIEQELILKNKSRKSSGDTLKSSNRENNEFSFSVFSQNEEENNFINKNVFPLNSEYFQQLISKYKNNNTMIGYLLYHMGETDKNKNAFSPECFSKKNKDDNLCQQVLSEYEKNFDKAIEIINDIFKSLLNHLYLLPYSIKCICKIIFSLIQKKNKRLNIFHQYAFISKFFFEKLFDPIFQNPGLGSLISNFIISTTTIKNLECISKIIITFVSGNLFKNNKEEEFYTPFNHYFLTKMPDLIKFFENIINVRLPSFIEKIINDELPEDYVYDYFKENPEEVVFHRSTIFTIDQLYLILELMDKNKKIIFNNSNKENSDLEKTFEKLFSKTRKEYIKKLKNNPEYEIIEVPIYNKKKKDKVEFKKTKGREIIKYYLISKLSLNQKYSNIFGIKQEKKYFNLPIINSPQNDEDNMTNNIIKVKNFFCTILYNYRILVKTDFEEDKIKDTKTILKEIKKFMKSSSNIIDDAFPSQWFVNSLLDYLNKIPPELVKDDCEFLINQIQNDIINSIKSLDFEDLSVLIDKMKFAKRGKINYENIQKSIIDIYLNKKAQNIIEKEIIEVEITFKYNEQSKELKIEPPSKNEKNLHYLDSIFEEPKKKPSKLCKTIHIFTKSFPNLLKYQNFYKVDVFQIEKELKVPQKIENYFKIIENHIKKNLNITDEMEFSNIKDKIYDFVMEKLYEKLFPKTINENDKIIHQKCEKLSWVEPKDFIKSKNNFIYDSFLPDLTNYIMLITKEKSIRKKIKSLVAIFDTTDKLGIFNGESQFGMDEQFNLLLYAFIKAKPLQIFSNVQYIQLFLDHGSFADHKFTTLISICQYIINLSPDQLNGVNKQDLLSNMNISSERNSSSFDINSVF